MFRGFAIASAALLAAAQAPLSACTFSANGANFDLTALSQGLTVQDNRNNQDTWDYQFSVCQDVAPPSGYGCANQAGPAFQYSSGGCFRLGDTAARGTFQPDTYNPSHGLMISYSNGDQCQNAVGQTVNRSLHINLRCYDTSGLLPAPTKFIYDMVNEETTCLYVATLFSRSGCPTQCSAGSNKPLCGGHGICDYDFTDGAAKCFCDTNWYGPTCGNAGSLQPVAPSYSGNIAGGFFGGIFAAAAVVAIFVFVRARLDSKSFSESYFSIFTHYGGSRPGGYSKQPADDGLGFYAQHDAPAPSGYMPPEQGGPAIPV